MAGPAAPVRVDQWVVAQPPEAWQRLTLRAGEKRTIGGGVPARPHLGLGWHRSQGAALASAGPPGSGASKISHYGLSNAPAHTPWPELAQVQAQRFFIEHGFRGAKDECGLADYQVRCWEAWPHHMALVMLGAAGVSWNNSK